MIICYTGNRTQIHSPLQPGLGPRQTSLIPQFPKGPRCSHTIFLNPAVQVATLNQSVRCNSLDILWSLCNNFRRWLCEPSGTAIYTYQLLRYYFTIPLDCVPKLVPLFNCCASLDKLHISLCFNFFISKARAKIIPTL